MKKKIVLSVSAIALAGLVTGCGSSSHHSSNSAASAAPATTTKKSVKAIDGYIIGANVCDANNICAATDANGTATAVFANTALSATAGYIDVNNNHKIDADDIKLPDNFTLKTVAGKSVISPVTDLIANGANPAQLAKILGVNEADLFSDPIATNNIALAKAIQIVYALKAENKESALVSKINTYNFSAQTDLPQMDKNTTIAQPKQETNTTAATTDLPPMKVVSTDLPPFGATTTAAPAKNNTTAANTANESKGSLALFANIASSVASAEAKTLITAVMSSTATSPVALEEAIASTKKDLLKTDEATISQNTAVETNTTVSTEVNTTSETNTTVSNEVNTTTATEVNTTAETNTTQTNTTQTNTASTDLPPF